MTHAESLILNAENCLNNIKRDIQILQECNNYKGDFMEANDRQFDAKFENLQFEIKRINMFLKDLPLSIF